MDPGMRILLVSPYPPSRDGIAAYAVQTAAALRAAGHDVDVLSPGPSAAHGHLDLVGPRGALALAKRVRRYDRVVIQFHPDVFYPLPPTPRQWAVESLALLAAVRTARSVEVVVHEIDYRQGRRPGVNRLASRALWRSVDRIVVHTERERDDFAASFGVDRGRIAVARHGADFVRRTRLTREQARRSLDLPEDATTFLAIGFVQPHKGFDRAVRAFAGLAERGCRLDIVGSVRLEDPAVTAYVAELEALAAATPGVHLHLGYLSDEAFDRWIVAADVVVLPYRSIWSSGVLARALLYGRGVVATAVGGLPEQAAGHDEVTLVGDDAELAAALWDRAGARPAVAAGDWPIGGPDLRRQVQEAVERRAFAVRGRLPDLAEGGPALRAAAAGVGAGVGAGFRAGAEPSARLRLLPPLAPPRPGGSRPLARLTKRVVRRLTGWEIDPLVTHVNALHAATLTALTPSPPPPLPPLHVTRQVVGAEDGSSGFVEHSSE